MKTEEDEAFEDIERRQGGGFPAKRAMAADKLHWSDCAVHNGPAYPAGPCDCGVAQKLKREALKLIGALHEHMAISSEERILLEKAITQPAQEPVAWCIKYGGVLLYAEGSLSKKEVEGNFARNFNEGLSEIIPFYTTPPKREWVELTDEDIERIKLMTYEKETDADGEEQEAVNIDWLIKTAEHFCKKKNT